MFIVALLLGILSIIVSIVGIIKLHLFTIHISSLLAVVHAIGMIIVTGASLSAQTLISCLPYVLYFVGIYAIYGFVTKKLTAADIK